MQTIKYIDMVSHIRKKNLAALQDTLKSGADPNWSSGKPLLEACADGWMPGVKALLGVGAVATARNSLALTLAIRNGHKDVAKLLIEAGAAPMDSKGQAISAAIEERDKELLGLLIGTLPPQPNPEQSEILVGLLKDALFAQFGVAQLLCAHAPYIQDRMYDATCTILQEGNYEILALLLHAGLDPNRKPPTAIIDQHPNFLVVACNRWTEPKDRLQIVQQLIDAGAQDPDGEALQAAQATEDSQLVGLLQGNTKKQG